MHQPLDAGGGASLEQGNSGVGVDTACVVAQVGEDQCQRQAGTGPRGEQAKACEQREQHVAHRLVAQRPERRVTVSNTPGRVSEWVISDEVSGT